jgi:uncharacterized zinc-type alcohol dehydrogenase-like protein
MARRLSPLCPSHAGYPQVIGHEVAGTVIEVGTDVTKHAVGDRVGVGTIVNSCRDCDNCRPGRSSTA